MEQHLDWWASLSQQMRASKGCCRGQTGPSFPNKEFFSPSLFIFIFPPRNKAGTISLFRPHLAGTAGPKSKIIASSPASSPTMVYKTAWSATSGALDVGRSIFSLLPFRQQPPSSSLSKSTAFPWNPTTGPPTRSTFHPINHNGNRSPEKQHPQHSRRQDRL